MSALLTDSSRHLHHTQRLHLTLSCSKPPSLSTQGLSFQWKRDILVTSPKSFEKYEPFSSSCHIPPCVRWASFRNYSSSAVRVVSQYPRSALSSVMQYLQHLVPAALSLSFGICLNSSRELLRPQIAQVSCDFAQLKHAACETRAARIFPHLCPPWWWFASGHSVPPLIASILELRLELYSRVSTLSLSRVFIIYLRCGIDSFQLFTRSLDLQCFQRWRLPDIRKRVFDLADSLVNVSKQKSLVLRLGSMFPKKLNRVPEPYRIGVASWIDG